VPFAVTTAAVDEFAVAEPSVFWAVTTTRSVVPTSAGCTTYVWFVAPAMSTHAAPVALQRCQR